MVALFYLIEAHDVRRSRRLGVIREIDDDIIRSSALVLLAEKLNQVLELQTHDIVLLRAIDAVGILQNQLLAIRNRQVQHAIRPGIVVAIVDRIAPSAGDLGAGFRIIQLHGIRLQRHRVGLVIQRRARIHPLQRILDRQRFARIIPQLQTIAVQLNGIIHRIDRSVVRKGAELCNRLLQRRLLHGNGDGIFALGSVNLNLRVVDNVYLRVLDLEERVRALGRNRNLDSRASRIGLTRKRRRQRSAVQAHIDAILRGVQRSARRLTRKHHAVVHAHRHAGHFHVFRKRVRHGNGLARCAVRHVEGQLPAQVL